MSILEKIWRKTYFFGKKKDNYLVALSYKDATIRLQAQTINDLREITDTQSAELMSLNREIEKLNAIKNGEKELRRIKASLKGLKIDCSKYKCSQRAYQKFEDRLKVKEDKTLDEIGAIAELQLKGFDTSKVGVLRDYY